MEFKIFLIRHGQDVDNVAGILNGHRDSELTELGLEQAQEVGEKLKNYHIDIIYSSPLKRAYQTACVIADYLNIEHKEIIINKNLIERDYGSFTGRLIKDAKNFSKNFVEIEDTIYTIEADGMENYSEMFKRAGEFFQELKNKCIQSNILVVTHAAMGRSLRAVYNNWGLEEIFSDVDKIKFGNCEIIELKMS